MKIEELYTFYSDENIEEKLKNYLTVRELPNNTLTEQLNKVKWASSGNFKFAHLFYLDEFSDHVELKKITIMVRYTTEKEAIDRCNEIADGAVDNV